MTVSTELDIDARYAVKHYPGVAFYVRGYALEWTDEKWEWDGEGDEDDEDSYIYYEPEQIENRQMVEAVMVGDDYVHRVDIEDLTVLDELDYCVECGQIGCRGDFRPREDD